MLNKYVCIRIRFLKQLATSAIYEKYICIIQVKDKKLNISLKKKNYQNIKYQVENIYINSLFVSLIYLILGYWF